MRALLLVGSPRGDRSTSSSLGRYLLEQLEGRGWEGREVHLHEAVGSPEGEGALVSEAGAADLVVVAFPTYIDSTPAAVVRAMSLLARERGGPGKRTPLVAIANCGFVEAAQNRTALDICRLFARDARFEWRGGLALGGGPAIDGRPLAEIGGAGRNARRSLELSAAALAEGREVPGEAVTLMAKSPMPIWMYVLFGNRGWRAGARCSGALRSIRDRPYMEEEK